MFRALVLTAIMLVLGVDGAPPPMDPDMAELAMAVRDSCLAETGAARAAIEAINKGASLRDSAGDNTVKCYIKCTMETAGMMSEGVVDVEATLALLPDELRQRTEPHLRRCDTQPGADHCEIAYNTQLCWQDANRDDYFLI